MFLGFVSIEFLCSLLFIILLGIFSFLVVQEYRSNGIKSKNKIKVAFFHPYCSAGGGGERVLWFALKSLQQRFNNLDYYIYTKNNNNFEEIVGKLKIYFGIELEKNIQLVPLKTIRWMEANTYPHFTMLGQALGSFLVGIEAAFKLNPAFALLTGAKIGCYVHYPQLSSHMEREISKEKNVYSYSKLIYYSIFSWMYWLVGWFPHVVLVNSSWTYSHMKCIWGGSDRLKLVYPPCDIKQLQSVPVKSINSEHFTFISLSQFRPEKRHKFLLTCFRQFLNIISEKEKKHVKLLIIGSCRNYDDEVYLSSLKKHAENLNLLSNLNFLYNLSQKDLFKILVSANAALHVMKDEHFGIAIVECMAAGLIILSHNSGGPKLDILKSEGKEKVGFLADDENDFALKMKEIFELPLNVRKQIASSARVRIQQFSNERFEESFLDSLTPLLLSLFD